MNDLEARVRRALQAEAEEGGLAPSPGAWDKVVAASVVHRRRWSQTVAVTVLAVVTVGAAVHVLRSAERSGEQVSTAQASGLPFPQESSGLLPFPQECELPGAAPRVEDLQPEDVDDLLFVPTWLPEGNAIQVTDAQRTSECSQVDDVAPVLVLRALRDGDTTIDAVISLHGPFTSTPYPPDRDAFEGNSYTRLRGTTAHIEVTHDNVSELELTWTEPDAVSWVLSATGTDEETLRAAAEALQIDSAPDRGAAFASLPRDEVPAGFDVVWQASELPPPARASTRAWVVTSVLCQIRFEEHPVNATIQATGGQPGDRAVRASGSHIGWFRDPDMFLWDVGPGVIGVADCNNVSLDAFNTLAAGRLAESIVPTDAQDAGLLPPID
jgi:hypothetical protein